MPFADALTNRLYQRNWKKEKRAEAKEKKEADMQAKGLNEMPQPKTELDMQYDRGVEVRNKVTELTARKLELEEEWEIFRASDRSASEYKTPQELIAHWREGDRIQIETRAVNMMLAENERVLRGIRDTIAGIETALENQIKYLEIRLEQIPGEIEEKQNLMHDDDRMMDNARAQAKRLYKTVTEELLLDLNSSEDPTQWYRVAKARKEGREKEISDLKASIPQLRQELEALRVRIGNGVQLTRTEQ